MRWIIGGLDANTGRHWEVTILARDEADAIAQASKYRQSPILTCEKIDEPAQIEQGAGPRVREATSQGVGQDVGQTVGGAPISRFLLAMVAPLTLLALVVKAIMLAADSLRRKI